MFPAIAIKSLLIDEMYEFCLAVVRFGCLKVLEGGIYRSPISANTKLFFRQIELCY